MSQEFTKAEWMAEGKRLFSGDFTKWRFKCPKCGNVATGQEFKEIGQEPDAMCCECIGRHVKNKGCDWASYGLFDICSVHVDGLPVFEFAPYEEDAQ